MPGRQPSQYPIHRFARRSPAEPARLDPLADGPLQHLCRLAQIILRRLPACFLFSAVRGNSDYFVRGSSGRRNAGHIAQSCAAAGYKVALRSTRRMPRSARGPVDVDRGGRATSGFLAQVGHPGAFAACRGGQKDLCASADIIVFNRNPFASPGDLMDLKLSKNRVITGGSKGIARQPPRSFSAEVATDCSC